MRNWTIENIETKEYMGRTLHRVVLTKDCDFGKKGNKMGWIEKESNLQDNAMVFYEAKICGDAVVYDQARVCGDAVVYGDARIFGDARVYDQARIYGDARIFGDAKVYDQAVVYGAAKVYDQARIYDNAEVYGTARVYGTASVCGNASVSCDLDYIVFKNWWSSGRYFTYTRSNDKYKVGCFYGTGKELIEKAYQDSEMSGRNYEKIVKYVESIKEELNQK